ncbi:MAG TPA: asparagine synthase (glutamine-hydrolyzing) [Blastocatellia bacterium]|jgi:asparagine synthase (glutamine-hydrolysing)|nr:asparagine synthase (glutamine-hydrolyzing) [Blastocatellia bacterium]
MCGICGIYEYGTGRPGVDAEVVAKMRDTMTHRGPDDAGAYVTPDRRVGLGHRRLSIVDLSSAGHNPMPNEDASVWITFNGEIYNHEILRAGLAERGHVYRSRTDTETIVHLYEERGLDFVREIEGDFAVALWDAQARRLVLARDRIGVKPLYYAISGGRLLFASEIKALLAHPSVSRDIDEEALYHYLTFLTTPAPGTLFAGIRKLPAGCMLTCDRRGEVRVERYWDAIASGDKVAELKGRSEDELAAELRRLLVESIEKRMMSDVPFGVFLSGGIDSTANVALMSRLMGRPVRTFTVGFSDKPEFNELEEARMVAREYGTDHHEILISQDDFLDFLPRLIFHQDEPIADPVCVPLYYVSKLAKQTGTTVVQVGEGADELFCGYSDYTHYLKFYDRAWKHLVRLPEGARRAAASALSAVYGAGSVALPPRWSKVVPDLLRRLANGEELFWSGAFVFDETHKQKLLSPAIKRRLSAATGSRAGGLTSHSVVLEDLNRLLAERPEADQLERMIYQELKLRLAELLLMRVDKVTMATSVEARVPFLDHRLVEFATAIPSSMKYRDGETKYILKRALRGMIPDGVLGRRKKGFGAPINDWMFDRLGGFVESTLLNSPLNRREIFDRAYLKELLRQQREGKVNYSFYLWSLFNLSLWYERWIEGPGRETGAGPSPAECEAGAMNANRPR